MTAAKVNFINKMGRPIDHQHGGQVDRLIERYKNNCTDDADHENPLVSQGDNGKNNLKVAFFIYDGPVIHDVPMNLLTLTGLYTIMVWF